jgi:hypothetical protein
MIKLIEAEDKAAMEIGVEFFQEDDLFVFDKILYAPLFSWGITGGGITLYWMGGLIGCCPLSEKCDKL